MNVANMDARVVCVFKVFILIILNCSSATCRMSKKTYPPMKDDIPFIKCDVCQKGMKYLHRKAKSMREESATKKVEEEKFQELVEKACNPDKFEGEWLAKLDIEEKDGELKITEHENIGSCKAECRTVAKACEDTVGEVDVDVAEELWKDDLSLSKLINQMCYSETKACTSKKPGKFQSTRMDEKFEVMSEDEKQAQEYMKRASDMPGMPNMQMYSREEMKDMVKTQSDQVPSDDQSTDDQDGTSHTSSNDNKTGIGLIWQTVAQVFEDIWEWIRSVFGLNKRTTEEL